MKIIQYTDQNFRAGLHHIIRRMMADEWKPEYIVGLTRGGLTPAVMLSHYLNIPMQTLNVSLRDENGGRVPEHNECMANDAFKYQKNILIVDDINDSGNTLNWIKADWNKQFGEDGLKIWHKNVRFAVLVDNLASNFAGRVDYWGSEINKSEDPQWLVFPWEGWYEV